MYLLGERVTDIAFWKSELNMEIGAMENESNDLKVLTSLPVTPCVILVPLVLCCLTH